MERSVTFIALSRLVPAAIALATVGNVAGDFSTISHASLVMRQLQFGWAGVEIAVTCMGTSCPA
jgi:hypothetical protein